MPGPLTGYRVVEMAGQGPGPFACMLLADLGADVVRIDRVDAVGSDPMAHADVLGRGRRSVALDLKSPAGVEACLRLVEAADAVVEGFRPGVMERLGLGPEVCLARNPRVVYGRMTGWGQEGPYATVAGHDINYIALAGALAHFGTAEGGPVPPLNLVGDFGGGGLFLALGIASAWLEREKSGAGQVIDAAMVDGTAALMAMVWGFRVSGDFDENRRGGNLIDTGAHFYNVYQCADGKYVSLGSIEKKFYAELLDRLGLAGEELPAQLDKESWPDMKNRFAQLFATRTRDQWCSVLEQTDVCFAPVLTMAEAARHPHNVARGTFVSVGEVVQPAPAPRFSRSAPDGPDAPPHIGEHTSDVLTEWGLSADEVAALLRTGAAR